MHALKLMHLCTFITTPTIFYSHGLIQSTPLVIKLDNRVLADNKQ